MKMIFWNLRNVGSTKLGKTFSPAVVASGVGNNVGEYIVRLVMGMAPWAGINPGGPADVFVVIELKSGGHVKGRAANGTAIPTLAALVNAMNAVANAGLVPPNTNPNFQYDAVPPLVVGRHETVGVIYNVRRLQLTHSGILRDDVNNRNILPRAPFRARVVDGGNVPGNIVGIHAPPPKGGAPNTYRPGIQFANSLTNSNQLAVQNQMNPEATFVGGDFNCDPTNTYGAPAVAFNMAGYATSLAANTLSSVRRGVNNNLAPPANYLSGAYDNVMHAFPGGAPGGLAEAVFDLIGSNAALYPGSVRMLLNNYNKVSDHMPVALRF